MQLMVFSLSFYFPSAKYLHSNKGKYGCAENRNSVKTESENENEINSSDTLNEKEGKA